MNGNGRLNSEISPRIQRLKDCAFKTMRQVDTERLRLLTEGYQAHEEQPPILRRAYALKQVLENMTVFLEEDQLLAGNLASRPMAAALYPEYSFDWVVKEINEIPLRGGDCFLVSQQVKDEILSLASYWKGRTLYDRCIA